MTNKWIIDTGLVFATLFAVLALGGEKFFLWLSIFVLGMLIFWPTALWPIAWAWDKLVLILGFIGPRVFFSIIFFIVISPMGLMKRLFKKDEMKIREWKKIDTAFVAREHLYKKSDFKYPY